MDREPETSLRAFFGSRRVALIGASSDPTRMGGRPLAMMKAHGFDGHLYAVNPRGGLIQGEPAYTTVKDIANPVDLAVCSVAVEHVEQVVLDCADKGVPGLVVFAGGFAEIGGDGVARQQRLRDLARECGVRMIGPNSMGFVNFATGLIASFHPAFEEALSQNGRIGLVTQSGAFAGMSAFMGLERGIGFSHIIATGNEVDIDAGDCIRFLAEDDDTDVILCYLEACRDGERMTRALAAAQDRNKPVVAVKLGRTDAGARAAQSHTAALVGNDRVYDALFRQYGVYRAGSLEEFFDVGAAASLAPVPADRSIGIVTVSGGVGVLLADEAAERGLDVAALPADAQAEMREMVPIAGTDNPLDLTGYIINNPALLGRAMRLIMNSAKYASIIAYQGALYRTPSAIEPHLPIWEAMRREYPDRLFTLSGFMSAECHRAFEALGVPTFREPTHAVRAVAAMAYFADSFRRAREARDNQRPAFEPPAAAPVAPVLEPQALGWLADAGIPVVPHRVAGNAADAVQAARELGYPVVLKIVAEGVSHKSELDGVRLRLQTDDEVRKAYESVVASCRRAAPDAKVHGCLVAKMVPQGIEVVVGAINDPVFGPAVMFGLGGVLVEALDDVSVRIAPFGPEEARRMIDETKGARILDGHRGRPLADRDAIAAVLARISELAYAERDRITSIEINPLVVHAQGAVAVDALVEGA